MPRLVAAYRALRAIFLDIATMDHGDGPRVRYRSNGFTFGSNSSGKMIPWMTSRSRAIANVEFLCDRSWRTTAVDTYADQSYRDGLLKGSIGAKLVRLQVVALS